MFCQLIPALVCLLLTWDSVAPVPAGLPAEGLSELTTLPTQDLTQTATGVSTEIIANTIRPCNSTEFTCDNKKCVPMTERCDSYDDCGGDDRSDELNCISSPCNSNEFTCDNKRCVSITDRCDSYDDCGGNDDRSDELNCTSCQVGYKLCDNAICTYDDWFCDGEDDCGDNSDEKNCTAATCQSDSTTCDNGNCIMDILFCDGNNDCGDNSDEKNCTANKGLCANGKQLSETFKCDGYDDCGDGTDEMDCVYRQCISSEFTCKNNKCIPMSMHCDLDNDCGDSSDENNCKVNDISTELSCVPPYHHVKPSKCVLLQETEPMKWSDAKKYCSQHNGTLISLASVKEIIFITQHLLDTAPKNAGLAPQFPYWVTPDSYTGAPKTRRWNVNSWLRGVANKKPSVFIHESSDDKTSSPCAFLGQFSSENTETFENYECSQSLKTPLCETNLS